MRSLSSSNRKKAKEIYIRKSAKTLNRKLIKIYDRKSKSYDRKSKLYDRKSKIFDRKSTIYDRKSKLYDRKSKIYDRKSKKSSVWEKAVTPNRNRAEIANRKWSKSTTILTRPGRIWTTRNFSSTVRSAISKAKVSWAWVSTSSRTTRSRSRTPAEPGPGANVIILFTVVSYDFS